MKCKKILLLAAVSAVLASGFVAVKARAAAEEKAAHASPFRGEVVRKVISKLELTDEQVEKIKTELRAEKETLATLLRQLHETKRNLRETIQSGGNETEIRAASAKVSVVEADLAVERAKLRAKIAPILTEEQMTKVKLFEEKMDNFVIQAIKNFGGKL